MLGGRGRAPHIVRERAWLILAMGAIRVARTDVRLAMFSGIAS